MSLLRDARAARKQGGQAIERRQRERLADMVAFARAHSPHYQQLYRGLPERVSNPALLPVTSKAELMARFDDWVTDPAVSLAATRAFVEDPTRIGHKLADRYTVVTTSGTTGARGIFLIDQRTLAVTSVCAARMLSSWLTAGDLARILVRGGRIAMVNATGGHFASVTAATALRTHPLRRLLIGEFSVQTPMPELVAALNRFRPAILAPYATTAALLASEQRAGRLHIDPVLVVLSAEGLAEADYDRIGSAFGAKVRQGYAASECTFLSFSCAHNWLHVSCDWAVLEAVDAEHQPVPAGHTSHTTLLSNLANRIQPILRYDLGDAILVRPDPCECGDPLPAIRVHGRSADVLTFPTRAGAPVTVAPLAISTLLDRIPGVQLFQIVHTAPAELSIRLQTLDGADADLVWQQVHTQITDLLSDHQLGHVTVTRATEPPQQTSGGKYRTVIP